MTHNAIIGWAIQTFHSKPSTQTIEPQAETRQDTEERLNQSEDKSTALLHAALRRYSAICTGMHRTCIGGAGGTSLRYTT